jgi:hypothetical protein
MGKFLDSSKALDFLKEDFRFFSQKVQGSSGIIIHAII